MEDLGTDLQAYHMDPQIDRKVDPHSECIGKHVYLFGNDVWTSKRVQQNPTSPVREFANMSFWRIGALMSRMLLP